LKVLLVRSPLEPWRFSGSAKGEFVNVAVSLVWLTGAKCVYVGNRGVAIGPSGGRIRTAGRVIYVG
jgi:hypothetical protein